MISRESRASDSVTILASVTGPRHNLGCGRGVAWAARVASGEGKGGSGMHVILLALGLVLSVGGIVLIGFAIPIEIAVLGNTLVLAGTVAIVGSLVLMGLASAIRQLRRIAQALEARPPPRELGPEPAEPAAGAHKPFFPFTPAPEPRVEPEPVRPAPVVEPPVESEPAGAAPMVEPPAAPLVVPPEPPVAATRDEPAASEPAAEAAVEREVPPPPVEEPVLPPPPPVFPPPSPPRPRPAAAAPPFRPPPPKKTFDTVWSGEPAAEPHQVAVEEAALAAAEAAPPRDDASAPFAPTAEPTPEPPAPEIFKSGVIDGMAYTLYTDGSIEAELAQGTVKFASIEP